MRVALIVCLVPCLAPKVFNVSGVAGDMIVHSVRIEDESKGAGHTNGACYAGERPD